MVIKVKPWGKDQGDYVLIDESDFDKSIHELYDGKPKQQAKPKEEKKDLGLE
jgi:hypothetical protein